MIVEILVTARQPVNALPQKIAHRVLHLQRIARIGQHPRQRRAQPQAPIGQPQQLHPAITAHVAALKTPLHFEPFKAWKKHRM